MMTTRLLLAIPVAAALAAAAGAQAQDTTQAMPGMAHEDASMPPAMGGMDGMHGGSDKPLPPVTNHVDVHPGDFGVSIPELGVEIIAVRLSAAGGLLDLRYRVLDVDKAKPLMDTAVPAQIVDPRTGSAGTVPMDEKVGSLRQNASRLRPGQVLAVLFGNPERALKKGDKVNLRLGGWEIAGLSIQG
jgi:hypothetical protein